MYNLNRTHCFSSSMENKHAREFLATHILPTKIKQAITGTSHETKSIQLSTSHQQRQTSLIGVHDDKDGLKTSQRCTFCQV